MSYNNGVGLNHVGAYQASGRPWCKHFTTTGAQSGFIEFPNVTKSIWAHVDVGGTGHSVEFAFCEPTRAVNMPDKFNPGEGYLSTTIGPLTEFTISLWFKFDSLPLEIRILDVVDDSLNRLRLQNKTYNNIRLANVGTGGGFTEYAANLETDKWYNAVITASPGEQKLYFNGDLVIERTVSFGSFHRLLLGSDEGNFNDAYSQIYLFNKALSEAEVSELYTTSARLNPYDHSASDNLLSYWATDDGAYGKFASSPDTDTLIRDRKSSNDLSLTGPGVMTFEDGWTIGNALESHSTTSTGHTQISFPFKCNKIFYSTSNTLQFSMFASLTNIPASQMFPLTGPGIDE